MIACLELTLLQPIVELFAEILHISGCHTLAVHVRCPSLMVMLSIWVARRTEWNDFKIAPSTSWTSDTVTSGHQLANQLSLTSTLSHKRLRHAALPWPTRGTRSDRLRESRCLYRAETLGSRLDSSDLTLNLKVLGWWSSGLESRWSSSLATSKCKASTDKQTEPRMQYSLLLHSSRQSTALLFYYSMSQCSLFCVLFLETWSYLN